MTRHKCLYHCTKCNEKWFIITYSSPRCEKCPNCALATSPHSVVKNIINISLKLTNKMCLININFKFKQIAYGDDDFIPLG